VRRVWGVLFLLFLSLGGFLLSGAFGASGEPSGPRLDLESYLLEVVGRNPSAKADRFKAQAQWEDLRATVADQRLQITLSPSVERWTYYPDQRSDQTLSLIFQQNVDLSGLYRAQERKALYAYRKALHDYGTTLNSLLASAEQAYWQCLFAEEKIALLEKILKQRREILELLKLELQENLITRLDVTKGEINLGEVESSLATARGDLGGFLEDLAGYVAGARIFPAPMKDLPEGLLSSKDLEESFEANPNIRSAQSNLDYTRMLYAIAQRQDSLKVQLQGTYRAWTDYTYHYSDVEAGEWDLLLYVEIPLVDGGKKKANIQKNRHLLEEAAKRLEVAQEQARKEYRKAREAWKSAADNVEVLQRQQEYARKNLDDTLTLYRERLTDVFDLMDALEKDQQARTQLLDAQLNMFLARGKIREQQGIYLARISEREGASPPGTPGGR